MIHSIDTETTGLKHAHGDRAFLVTYTDEKAAPQAVWVDRDSKANLTILCANRDHEWVGHNIGFDIPFLVDLGFEPMGPIHDTLIAAHVYNNLEEDKGLKALVKKYLGMENPEEQKLDEWFVINGYAKDKRKYQDVPKEIMEPYAKADVRMALALWHFYKKAGVIDSEAYKAEMAVLPVVTRIVARGMKIDKEYAKQEFDKAVTLISELETKALRDYGVDNLGSTAQIADALFTRGGLTCVTFTEKKNICLDSSALLQYDHPLVQIVSRHRDVSKLCGTYLEAILQKSHESRLYCSLNQVGARTGRFSCVAGYTMVTTDKGNVPIHQIKEGDMVLTHKRRFRRVIETQIKGEEPMYSVCFDNGYELTCTMSHKVLSSNGEWITIKEVIHEHFKTLGRDSVECGQNDRDVQERRVADYKSYCEDVGYDFPKCPLYFEKLSSARGIPSAEKNTVQCFQAALAQPYVSKDGSEASQLERDVQRRARVSHHTRQWTQRVCASCCYGQRAGDYDTAEKMGCTPYRWRQGEQPNFQPSIVCTFGAQAVTLYAGEGQPFRKVTKIYARPMLKVYDITVEEDHSYLAEGVFSHNSSDPNLQNIPRTDQHSPINLRKAFICEDDHKMLLIDLSQIELRILAHYAKEPAMIETLTDRAGDLHARTAIEMFGEVNKELRTVAKTLNFAIVYGAGGGALVEQLTKALPDKKITLSQAKDFKQKYLKGYPAVQSFLWAVQNTINSRGYVTGKSGRRYFCEKDKAYRASNYLIQGESAMIMKRMMCKVDELLKGKKTHMVNIIHDEFIFQLHKDEEYLIQELLAVIEDLTTWRVPLYANAEISETSWADKRKIK